MILIGYKRNDFDVDNKKITGFSVYFATPITSDKGDGLEIRTCYLSDKKLSNMNIALENIFNKDVDVKFNRYGKITEISNA